MRFEWAYRHQKTSWEKVLFTDECTFWLGRSGVCMWKPTAESNEYMVPKSVPKLNVWEAVCMRGKTSLFIFRQNMDASLYTTILEDKLPEVRSLFKSTSAWWWMQDNDPKHTSNLASKWFQKNRIHLIEWPSYSPDLNPIENIWGWIKKKIGKKRPRSLSELEEELIRLGMKSQK